MHFNEKINEQLLVLPLGPKGNTKIMSIISLGPEKLLKNQ